MPREEQRGYASPRKYEVDSNATTATEVWNFEVGQSIVCPYCSSVYEDAPKNYLLDYAFLNGGVPGLPTFAQLLGLNARGETIFSYRYATISCTKACRAFHSSGKYEVPDGGDLKRSTSLPRGSFRSVTTF